MSTICAVDIADVSEIPEEQEVGGSMLLPLGKTRDIVMSLFIYFVFQQLHCRGVAPFLQRLWFFQGPFWLLVSFVPLQCAPYLPSVLS